MNAGAPTEFLGLQGSEAINQVVWEVVPEKLSTSVTIHRARLTPYPVTQRPAYPPGVNG